MVLLFVLRPAPTSARGLGAILDRMVLFELQVLSNIQTMLPAALIRKDEMR